jgi:hypothetical protein
VSAASNTPAITVTASNTNTTGNYSPSNTVDNDESTRWNSGAPAPQWIEFDLGTPQTISGMSLTVAQAPAGNTTHQIYAGSTPNPTTLVRILSGNTTAGQILTPTFAPALTNVRYVRVVTTASPSWVAWGTVRFSNAAIKYSAANPLRIAMYGDSTVFGNTFNGTTHVQSPDNVPATVQTLLQNKYGLSVLVENHGVPGTTCPQWLSGTGPITQSWKNEIAQTDAQIVSMDVGINDAYQAASQESEADFSACYRQLSQMATAAGKLFVFETANQITTDHAALLGLRMQDETNVQLSFPQSPLIDEFAYTAGLSSWPTMLSDQIHPTGQGYILEAQKYFSVIDPIVGAMLSH